MNVPARFPGRVLGLAACLLASATVCAEVPRGVLQLLSGDTLPGEFRASATADALRWQASGFTAPFEFPLPHVASIQLPAADPTPSLQGEFALELLTGDVLAGTILSWNSEHLVLQTSEFGRIQLKPSSLRRLYRLDDNPAVVFPSLTGLTGWRMNGKEWREDGPQIETNDDLSIATADMDLPDLAVIEFEVSWFDKPSFVFAIGVDPAGNDDKRQDGWRFETWGDTLTIVREQARQADVDRVHALIPSVKRTHLFAYLNQVAGELHIFHSGGTPAASITVPPEPERVRGRGVRLINRQGGLRLERLRIARWNGVLPFSSETDQAYCQLTDGNAVAGRIIGLSDDGRTFQVQHGETERTVSQAELVSAEISYGADDRSGPTAVLLQNGVRISGRLDGSQAGKIVLTSPHVAQPLTVPYADLRSLMVYHGKEEPAPTPIVEGVGRRGRLEIGSLKSAGWLTPHTAQEGESCLAWQPEGSRLSSPLRAGVAGRIVYQERVSTRTKPETSTTNQRATAGRNFADLFLKRSKDPLPIRPLTDTHQLHLRSGDVVHCSVQGIDETGVLIESEAASANHVPHAYIKALELVKDKSPPNLAEAKRARLLTLPRLQKSSPPTHLVCSRTGDFLRCRVLSMTDKVLTVEVQLGEMEIPLERVAQIIWFHPEELTGAPLDNGEPSESAEAAAPPEAPPSAPGGHPTSELVQGVHQNGTRMTCHPSEFDGTRLKGVNAVLGECSIAIGEIAELIFGREIEADLSQLAYHEWRLSPAIEPLVMQEGADEAAGAGSLSPLVGETAPEIDLEQLGGGRFKLSQHRGQFVVLDFWASWCGPCIQTMPLVEEAMREFDPNQVKLVAINLEERAEQIEPVLQRYELSPVVALDIDGVAAHRYQATAIPQLVIVDREGKVARLYIGGGPGVVEQLKAALKELIAAPTDAPPKTRPDA